MDNEKLIFSTEGLVSKAGFIVLLVIACLFIPIISLDSAIGLIIFVIYIAIASFLLNPVQCMYKSFIKLYDDHVEGYAIPQTTFKSIKDMSNFSLQYKEITYVNYKKDVVIIHFKGGTYEVQAKGVEQKVIEIIKSHQQ